MALFQENEEFEMSKDIIREANENAPQHPQQEEPAEEESHKLVELLSGCFLLLGVVNFIAGFVLADDAHDNEWAYIIGGIFGAMVCFGWAALTKVCALYVKEHDK